MEFELHALGPIGLQIGQVDIVGVQIADVRLKVAALVIGGNILPGIDHHPHVVQALAGDVGHGGGDGKVAAVFIGFPGVVHLQSLGHIGEVQGGPGGLRHVGVGEHAVVACGGGAAPLSHRAQVIVQGEGAVGSQVVPVVGGGEIEACVGVVVKDGGRQVVPVGKGHLRRRAGRVAHGAVEEVGEHAGILGVVVGEEAVLVAGNALLALHRQVAAAGLGHLVDAVILGAQGGVHQQPQLHLGRFAGVLGGIAQVGHAVLGGAGIGQADGLGDGDAVHRPHRPDLLRRGGHRHVRGALVLAAEHIVLGLAVPGDPEGGKGGVVLSQGEEEVLVVVVLPDGVALQGADGEAAAAAIHQHLQVLVGQGIHVLQLRRQDGNGQQSRDQAQGQRPGQEAG